MSEVDLATFIFAPLICFYKQCFAHPVNNYLNLRKKN